MSKVSQINSVNKISSPLASRRIRMKAFHNEGISSIYWSSLGSSSNLNTCLRLKIWLIGRKEQVSASILRHSLDDVRDMEIIKY